MYTQMILDDIIHSFLYSGDTEGSDSDISGDIGDVVQIVFQMLLVHVTHISLRR
jgi:hypothetical protein